MTFTHSPKANNFTRDDALSQRFTDVVHHAHLRFGAGSQLSPYYLGDRSLNAILRIGEYAEAETDQARLSAILLVIQKGVDLFDDVIIAPATGGLSSVLPISYLLALSFVFTSSKLEQQGVGIKFLNYGVSGMQLPERKDVNLIRVSSKVPQLYGFNALSAWKSLKEQFLTDSKDIIQARKEKLLQDDAVDARKDAKRLLHLYNTKNLDNYKEIVSLLEIMCEFNSDELNTFFQDSPAQQKIFTEETIKEHYYQSLKNLMSLKHQQYETAFAFIRATNLNNLQVNDPRCRMALLAYHELQQNHSFMKSEVRKVDFDQDYSLVEKLQNTIYGGNYEHLTEDVKTSIDQKYDLLTKQLRLEEYEFYTKLSEYSQSQTLIQQLSKNKTLYEIYGTIKEKLQQENLSHLSKYVEFCGTRYMPTNMAATSIDSRIRKRLDEATQQNLDKFCKILAEIEKEHDQNVRLQNEEYFLSTMRGAVTLPPAGGAFLGYCASSKLVKLMGTQAAHGTTAAHAGMLASLFSCGPIHAGVGIGCTAGLMYGFSQRRKLQAQKDALQQSEQSAGQKFNQLKA